MYYFDNAATSYPKPEEVYEFMDSYYRKYGFNSNRSYINGELSEAPSMLIDKTRKLLLELFNSDNKKVTFIPSATIAMNVVLQGLSFEKINNVYVSVFEHNAVIRTLHYLQKKHGFDVIELTMNKDDDVYDLEGIKYQFQQKKPDLLIVNHASNVTGLIAPIYMLCEMAKKYDAITVIDIAQSAGQIEVDLQSNYIDFAVFAGHKSLLGSFGIGGFISTQNISLEPFLYGGTGLDSANPELPVDLPERYEVGSTNILAISSLYASLMWIKKNGFENIRNEKAKKTRRLLELLGEYPDIKVYRKGPLENYVNVVSFKYNGYSSDNIGEILAKQGVIVRAGLHCAPNAHKYLGTFPEGTIRLSIGSFTTEVDFDAIRSALDYIENYG